MWAWAQYSGCDFYQTLEVGKKYEIFSRGYKNQREAKRFIFSAIAWILHDKINIFQ
jgi:hypothetical protein